MHSFVFAQDVDPRVAAVQAINPVGADATHVYWSNSGSGEIVSYDRQSGERRVVASGQTGVELLAADASRLYWTTSSHVMRLAK